MDQKEKQLGEHKALHKLKNRGGKGQEGVQIIDGSVLTVKETIATTIAKDIIDDAKRGLDKPFAEMNLLEIAQYAEHRTKGRPVTDGEVLAEIVRLQNHEIYGDKLIRS